MVCTRPAPARTDLLHPDAPALHFAFPLRIRGAVAVHEGPRRIPARAGSGNPVSITGFDRVVFRAQLEDDAPVLVPPASSIVQPLRDRRRAVADVRLVWRDHEV